RGVGWRAHDPIDPRVRQQRHVKLGSLFGLPVEPQIRGNLLHRGNSPLAVERRCFPALPARSNELRNACPRVGSATAPASVPYSLLNPSSSGLFLAFPDPLRESNNECIRR